MDMVNIRHAKKAQALASDLDYRKKLHEYTVLPEDMKTQWAKKAYGLQSEVSLHIASSRHASLAVGHAFRVIPNLCMSLLHKTWKTRKNYRKCTGARKDRWGSRDIVDTMETGGWRIRAHS